jgi:CRP/FNR family transcriptional regulator, cyclic AMP receptor protein
MSLNENSSPTDRPDRRALFPWFPAHQVRPSEQQLRAEALIGHIPLFRAVPPYRLRSIAHAAHRNRFSAGETVLRTGEMGSTLHVIRTGLMHVVRETAGGGTVILASLGPGEFFGELALFDNQPRSATVVAAEDSETLSLGRADILEVINRYPEVAQAFLSSICARLRTTDNLLENFSRTLQAEQQAE